MSIKIAKWGNSLGIRIPKQIVEQIQLTEGMELEITREDNKLILTPRTKQYTLKELLEGMSEHHLHSEIDWGEPVGKEQW
ncbi:MAG: AbrB/MazE/SpoVT family DNA-binding domain-containing protein [Waterburya sp.]